MEKFNHYEQFVSDAQDAKVLKKTVINQQFLSKSTNLGIIPKTDKIDKFLFIGQWDGVQYVKRRDLINYMRIMGLEIDVVPTARSLSYLSFLSKLNEYKYILNPLGTGEFVNLRHHEAVRLGCIPVQQITITMHDWCKSFETNGVFFSHLNEFYDKLAKFDIAQRKEICLEDYFDFISLRSYL